MNILTWLYPWFLVVVAGTIVGRAVYDLISYIVHRYRWWAWNRDTLRAFRGGAWSGLPTDLAENHDKYCYDEPSHEDD